MPLFSPLRFHSFTLTPFHFDISSLTFSLAAAYLMPPYVDFFASMPLRHIAAAFDAFHAADVALMPPPRLLMLRLMPAAYYRRLRH